MEILVLPFLPGKDVSCNRKELLVELAEMLSFPLLSEISTNSSEKQEESTNEFPRISTEMQPFPIYSNGSFSVSAKYPGSYSSCNQIVFI